MKTILAVDDTPSNLDILIDLLEEYDVIDATNGEDALDIANEEDIDLILLDIMMPDMDGFEVCKQLKANEKTKDIPIIFITGQSDEESIQKAYEYGGSDYVTKPFLPLELKARVKKELKIQEMMEELRLLASTDPLTKLYNRRYFYEVSQHIFMLAKREQSDLGVIMLDIDKFKSINDTYGHQVGDEVIKFLASTLQKSLRKSDVACRYGGEEFVILLPHIAEENIKELAEKIRVRVESSSVKLGDEKELKFTISLGCAKLDSINDTSLDMLIHRADEALYEAKNSGRNKVVMK